MIHHTDCGTETFTDEVMRSLLRQSLSTAELGADGWRDVGPAQAPWKESLLTG